MGIKTILPDTLPEDVSAVISRVERVEGWVRSDPSFRAGQIKLFKMLGTYKSHLPQKEFLKHFVIIVTFSGFRDAVALMKALECNHDCNLQRLLLAGMTGAAPDNEYWKTNAMRIRYLTAWHVLARGFDEKRIEAIKQALTTN